MAKRYELSDEAWDVVCDLFIETHGRRQPRLSDRPMLEGVLWVLCCVARYARALRPMVNGVSTVSGLAKSRNVRSDAQRLHLRLNEQGLIDLQTWMIDSTTVRATRVSSDAGKKRA